MPDEHGYMMPGLDPEEDLFRDMEMKDGPEDPVEAALRLCPKCKGHGGWRLKVDCYESDIPANRHFTMTCGSCFGYGYLQPGQTCAHEWKDKQTVGRCLHEWECIHCGETRVVDSSG